MADDGSTPSTIASLLRQVGGWSQPGGRGLFMFNMLTTNVSVAALTGVATAYATGFFLGPLASVGFVVGSSVGWFGSAVYHWQTTQANAMQAFEEYPQLMMMHLIRNYRTFGFERTRMETAKDKEAFRERLQKELTLRCFLMAAWHTARPSIDEISDRKEAQLVDKLSSETEA